MHIDNCTPAIKPNNDFDTLLRRLTIFRNTHMDETLRRACQVLIDYLQTEDMKRYTPKQIFSEVEALRRALAIKMKHPEANLYETIAEIQELLFNDEMF